MARKINRLSARAVSTITRPGRHADGAGLYLSISPAKAMEDEKDEGGGRRWVFIFKRGGKSREMGLGSAKTVSLARARDLADDARTVIARGLDPIAVRQETIGGGAASLSFKECATRCIEAKRPGWRNAKHGAQGKRPLRPMPIPKSGLCRWRLSGWARSPRF